MIPYLEDNNKEEGRGRVDAAVVYERERGVDSNSNEGSAILTAARRVKINKDKLSNRAIGLGLLRLNGGNRYYSTIPLTHATQSRSLALASLLINSVLKRQLETSLPFCCACTWSSNGPHPLIISSYVTPAHN